MMELIASRSDFYPPRSGPLTVVLYGGPGTGKSTTASMVFASLKQAGRNVEIVHEVAKEFTWERRDIALSHQPYMVSKQMFKMDRLRDSVEAIVTDTSPLLALVYGKKDMPGYCSFCSWLLADEEKRNTMNVLITRDPERTYNPKGRSQSEDEAKAVDAEIRGMLLSRKLPFYTVPMQSAHEAITAEALKKLT